jgi:phage replication-related protein YjqB (UPF0714/DUF867 family)
VETFADLLSHPGVTEMTELRSRFGFLAFHGGLEAGTHDIAARAAAEAGASLYAVVQPADLRWHIPSHLVQPAMSPALAQFLEHVEVAIAVHGYGRKGRSYEILLGGRNRDLAARVAAALSTALPDYEVIDDLDRIPVELRGLHRANPVNRPRLAGVQLELPPRARDSELTAHLGGVGIPVDGLIDALAQVAAGWVATGDE